MPKIENKRDSNYYYAKNSSLITADVDGIVKRQMEKYQSMEHPSYEDSRHQMEQREEGTRLFNSGVEISLEELKAKGYYVKQQYFTISILIIFNYYYLGNMDLIHLQLARLAYSVAKFYLVL